MLYIDFKSLLEARNISNPHKFLLENGFTKPMAYRILHRDLGTVRLTHLYKLCKLLNCTPNDVIRYHDNGKDRLDEKHALNRIKDAPASIEVVKLLKALPIEEMNKVAELLKGKS